MAFEIESGIEIPTVTRSYNGEEKYPFSKLEVGQSFFVGDDEVDSGDARKTMFSAVSAAHERFSVEDPSGAMRTVVRGKKVGEEVPMRKRTRAFSVRSMTSDGAVGVRVFRTI